MELFSKDEILNADDASYRDVLVPEWGEGKGVRLKGLTGTQRDDFEDKTVIQKGGSQKMNLVNFRSRLLSLCIVNGEGQRLFSDVEVNLLGQKNGRVLEKLFDVAREMNGMSDQDVKDLTEGFGDGPSGASTSD